MLMSMSTLNQTITTQALYVLLAVAERPLHGYGIRDQIARDSESQLILAMGTVYPILKRLTEAGLLEYMEDSVMSGTAGRYRITRKGLQKLEAEVRRMGRVVIQVRQRMNGP